MSNEWKDDIGWQSIACTHTYYNRLYKSTQYLRRAGTEQKGLWCPPLSPSSNVGENPLSNFGANLLI